MATPVRITGLVLTVTNSKGLSKAGNPYHRREAGVLVAGIGVTAIQSMINAEDPDPFNPVEGEFVDLVGDADVYGGRLSVNYLRVYDEDRAAAVADAVTA